MIQVPYMASLQVQVYTFYAYFLPAVACMPNKTHQAIFNGGLILQKFY